MTVTGAEQQAGRPETPAAPLDTEAVRADFPILGRAVRGGSHLVAPGFPATIIEWLVEDGDPVSAGQPLVRLQPAAAE